MSKQTFKLKVPTPEVIEGQEPDPRTEFVSHGNHDFELVAGETVTTTDPRVRDWLIGVHGLELVETIDDDGKPAEPVPASNAPTDPEANERTGDAPPDTVDPQTYPADFPGREKLIEANVAFDTVKTLTAEQLDEYPGIGPKTAAEILSYFADQEDVNNG
jgi:hypothetical protein